jgi:hypothetical protein
MLSPGRQARKEKAGKVYLPIYPAVSFASFAPWRDVELRLKLTRGLHLKLTHPDEPDYGSV